ncbi:MAG: outer membrane protein assembly factor BamA [Acidobacteria bacterium]|nr:outer membrane protein assembly factor BamA [Acidobacteriota bacterium]
MVRRAILVAACVVLLAPSVARADVQPSAYYGRIVASVAIRADMQMDTTELGKLVLVAEGSPLAARDVDRSIRALFATGQFRDVRVDAVHLEDGRIAITFLVFVNYKVASVEYDGLVGEQEEVKSQVVVHAGEVFSLSAVDRSANAMQQALRRRGWVGAVVDPATEFQRDTRSAQIVFYVTAGVRATIARVRFEGTLEPYGEERIAAIFGKREGELYSSGRVHEWGEKLRQRLVNEGYRAAEVSLSSEQYDAGTGTMTLIFRVEVGPEVVVVLTGDRRRALRNMLPRGKRQPYSADDVDRAVDEMLDYYQARGYYFAEIEVNEKREGNRLTIEFLTKPGKRYAIGKVRFVGNVVVPADEIAKVIETAKPSVLQKTFDLFARQGLGVTQAKLDDDRSAIEAFYRSKGFIAVTTETPRINVISEGELEVIFPIVEGPQTMLQSVAVEGNYAIATERLPELLARAGEPASPRNIALDTISIQSAYDKAGFPDSRVEPITAYTADRTSADLIYKVIEGTRFRIGEVAVVGNSYTDERVVRIRTKDLLKRGRPLSFATLNEAQRELYKLSVFGRVSIVPKPQSGTSQDRDLEIRVEEGKAVRLTGSVGYSTDENYRVSATISHRNIFGTGRYLGLETVYSEPKQKVVLTFQEPFTFNQNMPTQVSVFQDDELKDDVLLERRGMFVELSKLLRRDLRVALRYDYRVVNYTCDASLDEEQCNTQIVLIGQEEKEDTIASVTQTVFWDRRNDVLDPKKGFLVLGSLEYAFPVFSAEPKFLKGYLQANWYQPVGKATLALSARGGAIDPRSNLDDPINPTPYSERFFGGGENSHRGFRLDRLGIFGDVNPFTGEFDPPGATIFDNSDPALAFTPQGGNAMLIGNVELRYPLSESLGIATFVDVGQVWRLVSTIDLDYLKYAVGAGVFYRTPVGPIRFDLAYNLDADEAHNESKWLEFITIGFAF